MLRRLAQRLPLQQIRARRFTVIAFESSADDSCVAIVNSHREILANVVIGQDKLNESFGGIQPMVALDAHQHHLPIALRRALEEANMTPDQVDGVAFTRGPGMPGCLSVCMNAAKTLAAAHNKPLVGVHHMQAHALTPLLTLPPEDVPQFPFLTLLISGGHTLLVLARSHTEFETLATTGDESIGRGLDKVARVLGLPPKGAALETFCAEPDDPDTDISDVDMGRPLSRPLPGQLAFSFAGIRSQFDRNMELVEKQLGATPAWKPVANFVSPELPLPPRQGGWDHDGLTPRQLAARRQLGRMFQDAAFAHVADKVALGLKRCRKNEIQVQALIVSGGVASNKLLRKRLGATLEATGSDIPLLVPPMHLCTDNAAMIAWASMSRFKARDYDDFSVRLRPEWPLDQLTVEPEKAQNQTAW
ncbi:peptidase M22, glycoprotease [Auricularia subglabra TFB-10046 SS5]|nr:peptidase M22, glycoprotease [Auricularia subglabra TFB-10046 SS5]